MLLYTLSRNRTCEIHDHRESETVKRTCEMHDRKRERDGKAYTVLSK
ncbi:hypothetical protein SAMN06265376_1073 [Dokdonia pacifica]|uniref:Uncharacterized protein n=1 Tax=Dokdonia pacifica TaxID=1627892 RepID=A0A239BX38_9FLAO|nr:hypothetical protein SAMN06265376_1073 [Dokdonia pacifica]